MRSGGEVLGAALVLVAGGCSFLGLDDGAGAAGRLCFETRLAPTEAALVAAQVLASEVLRVEPGWLPVHRLGEEHYRILAARQRDGVFRPVEEGWFEEDRGYLWSSSPWPLAVVRYVAAGQPYLAGPAVERIALTVTPGPLGASVWWSARCGPSEARRIPVHLGRALQMAERYRAAYLALEAGRLREAVVAAAGERRLEQAPCCGDHRVLRARLAQLEAVAHLKLGHAEEARVCLGEAVRLEPRFPAARAQLLWVEAMAEDLRRGRVSWPRAAPPGGG